MTVADLLEKLGGVPPERVRMKPLPGTATEEDLIAIQDRENRNCELIDGVLVEKPLGYPESALAAWLSYLLQNFLVQHDLGNLAGESGSTRLMPGLVRIPDVSFISWDRLPSRTIPSEPILGLAPDLAVEVLSPSNTKREMDLKVREYFLAGVRLVWLVDMTKRSVRVYTAPDESTRLTEGQTLDGGDVLPGLRLPLREVFARTPRSRPRKKRAKE
ncbi:MAG TPA: Uma2 family endonuclease [Gemmataceae bacterium]|jgi:Uma2 family endonuclease|nr:Uma2 family endonuclease [Gemmataceae bacterium]